MGIKITNLNSATNIIKRLTRNLLLRTQPRAVILLYHRIANIPFDPNLINVTPEHFSEHLEYLRKHYRLMSLTDLSKTLSNNKVPDKTVVITLDDGYLDNFRNAKPLLEHYEAPATIFVSSGYLGKNKEFWWDELERIIFLSKEPPKQFELDISGKLYKWELHKNNNKDLAPKVYMEIQLLLRNLDEEKIKKTINDLALILKSNIDARDDYRAINFDELKIFASNGLIRVGSHAVTHPALTKLSTEMQKQELTQSKSLLEDILCRPIDTFSYPYGYWNEHTVSLVREAGYKTACSTVRFPVLKKSNPYCLPRFGVKDWNGDEFAKGIRRFFNAPV
jgi:peptidoglycan/xylan/chitin deacetylase (PgdA/CDA1 family)